MSDRTSPLRLYLMRHGETAWSLSGQHTGVTEIPLTTHGEDEARALAPHLRDVVFTKVFTSPRQRARETCRLAGLEVIAVVEPDLAEWDYGDYEGKRSADIHETQPAWNIFNDGCPHGETTSQVSDRADLLISRLRGFTGNIALFSHGHFGAVLATRWISLPVAQGLHFPIHTAALGVLGYDASHPDIPVIAHWNLS